MSDSAALKKEGKKATFSLGPEGGAGLPVVKTFQMKTAEGQTLDVEVTPNSEGKMDVSLVEKTSFQDVENVTQKIDNKLMRLEHDADRVERELKGETGSLVDVWDKQLGSKSGETPTDSEEGELLLDESAPMEMEGLALPEEGELPEGGAPGEERLPESFQGGNPEDTELDPDAAAFLAEWEDDDVGDPEIQELMNAPDPFENIDEGELTDQTDDLGHLLEGVVEERSEEGILESQMTFHLGKLHGPTTFYYPDGTVQERVSFKEGVLDGPFEQYDEDGDPITKLFYRQGKLNGRGEFYDNKHLAVVVNYVDNKLHGTTQSFTPHGQVLSEITFENGEQTGPLRSYSDEGAKTADMNYYKGILQGGWQAYYPSGELLMQGSYNEGSKEGTFVTYYDTGTASHVAHYQNGKLIEVPISFDKKGREVDP